MESEAGNSKSTVLALSMLGVEQELTVDAAVVTDEVVGRGRLADGAVRGTKLIGGSCASAADGAGNCSSVDGRVTAFRVTDGFSGTMRKRR